jgi:hypothetical protein
MANNDIGDFDCPACGESAAVRQAKTGKVYIMCRSPVCGFQGFARGTDSDAHIRRKMRQIGAGPAPDETKPATNTPPATPPKRKGFFDDLADL